MNASQFLEELQRRNVVLWANGERLGFDGPPEVLTPPVLAAMKASKRELLLLLEAQAAPVVPSASVEVEAEPLVLERPASRPAPPQVDAARLQRARELGAILTTFPNARLLRSGKWKIGGEVLSHDDALLDAAHASGTTSGGFAVEFETGRAFRVTSQNAINAPQELEED